MNYKQVLKKINSWTDSDGYFTNSPDRSYDRRTFKGLKNLLPGVSDYVLMKALLVGKYRSVHCDTVKNVTWRRAVSAVNINNYYHFITSTCSFVSPRSTFGKSEAFNNLKKLANQTHKRIEAEGGYAKFQ